jgi:hypothetical protein
MEGFGAGALNGWLQVESVVGFSQNVFMPRFEIFFKLPPYTLVAFYLTTHSSKICNI